MNHKLALSFRAHDQPTTEDKKGCHKERTKLKLQKVRSIPKIESDQISAAGNTKWTTFLISYNWVENHHGKTLKEQGQWQVHLKHHNIWFWRKYEHHQQKHRELAEQPVKRNQKMGEWDAITLWRILKKISRQASIIPDI